MKKEGLFIPLGLKLTAMVSLLIALSLGALTVVATWFYGADIERTLRTNTLERVELISRSLEAELNSRLETGKLIAATLDGSLVFADTGIGPTAGLLAKNPEISSVYLISRESGRERITASAGTSGLSPARIESLFPTILGPALDRAFAARNAAVNLAPESGESVMGLLAPFSFEAEGRAETVLLVVVSSAGLSRAMGAQELYVNYLVDGEGNLLAHPDPDLVRVRASFAKDPIVEDSLQGKAASKQMQFTAKDGVVYIGSFNRFFSDSLSVVSVVRKDLALEGVYQLQTRNILITILILCASMLLLFAFSKTITNPLARLMHGAERIRDGDFAVTIPPSTRDEIGRLSATFNAMATGLAERDKIKSAFGKFVNKELAEKVLKGEVQLGGESKRAAIFFSDIRSFTSISENLTPHEVVEFLNAYMTRMVECVNHTHGIVDKYIGDAIMATWGIPESHGNDTANAVTGALAMRTALAEFNQDRGGPRKPIIRIGCGINTGEVIAGQIGSPERMEYTCIGDAVNFASRIESLNKLFKTDILISEEAHELVKHLFRTVPMKKVSVKGKEGSQQIYAVLSHFTDPHGFHTIEQLREHLGYENVNLDGIDADREEEKYELIE